MQFWCAKRFILGCLQFRVRYRAHVLGVLYLVQGDLLGEGVLNVACATIGEVLPQDFELTKDLLDLEQYLFDNFGTAGDLQVIDVLRHDAYQLALLMPATELGIDLAGNEVALVPCYHAQLDAEGKGCVDQPGAGFVAMQHLL